MAELTDKEMQQKMELQLHEQYAINNNAYLSSIVTLLVGLLAAIGAYGYVFLHSTNYFEDVVYLPSIKYSLTQLSYALVGAVFVTDVIMCLCIYQGIAQRCEQFIAYTIRYKYGKKDFINEIFPPQYYPFGKKGLKIVQGFYGEFVKIGIWTQMLLFISYIYKLCLNIWNYKCCGVNIYAIVIVCIVFVLCACCNLVVIKCLRNSEEKYIKKNNEYLKRKIDNEPITLPLLEEDKNDLNKENLCCVYLFERKYLCLCKWVNAIFNIGK